MIYIIEVSKRSEEERWCRMIPNEEENVQDIVMLARAEKHTEANEEVLIKSREE